MGWFLCKKITLLKLYRGFIFQNCYTVIQNCATRITVSTWTCPCSTITPVATITPRNCQQYCAKHLHPCITCITLGTMSAIVEKLNEMKQHKSAHKYQLRPRRVWQKFRQLFIMEIRSRIRIGIRVRIRIGPLTRPKKVGKNKQKVERDQMKNVNL